MEDNVKEKVTKTDIHDHYYVCWRTQGEKCVAPLYSLPTCTVVSVTLETKIADT